MYRAISIGDCEIPDELWRDFHEFVGELKDRYHTPYSLVSWQTTRDRTLSRVNSDEGNERAIVMNDERIVAWVGLNGRNIGTPGQTAFFIFDFLDEYGGPDIEGIMIAQIGRWMDKYELKECFGVVNDEHRKTVLENWGAQKLSRLNEYILDRESARHDIIEEWLRTIPRQHPDLKLEFYQFLPEHLVRPFSELLVETLRAMPEEARGGLPFHTAVQDENEMERWRQKNGMTLYKYLMFDDAGPLVAMTLVDVDTSNPTNVFQQMTGITERYRARGLAKWLKAAMFKKLGEDFPSNKRLITSMRADNRPMMKINDQMGFELFRHGLEYKVSASTVENFLQSALPPRC